MQNLITTLKARGVTSIGYFHADHFEPWPQNVNTTAAYAVERFGKLSGASKFGKKLSLFYKTFIPYAFHDGSDKYLFVSGDEVGFRRLANHELKMLQDVIAPLENYYQHEFQMHIHHEAWTKNESNFNRDVSKWVNANSSDEQDFERLRLCIQIAKKQIEFEIGRSFDSWAFVHGNWALNGSDKNICNIQDEIALLMSEGCWGDFTFPARKEICDPTIIDQPYTCNSIPLIKGYDSPLSEPRSIFEGSGRNREDRFFIWNSEVKSEFCSLDFYSESNRKLFKSPEVILDQWFRGSPIINGRLMIKTFSHSMIGEYSVHIDGNPIPHTYPDIVKLFELLDIASEKAQVPIELMTIDEVNAFIFNGTAEKKQVISDPHFYDSLWKQREKKNIMGVKEAIELVNNEICKSVKEWISLDEDRNKEVVSNFYLVRLNRSQMISNYEIGVIEYVANNYDVGESRIFEVGIGFGTLCLVLAVLGYQTTGYEGDSSRIVGTRFVLERLTKLFPQLKKNFTLVDGFFPGSLDMSSIDDDKLNLLIATNIIHSVSAKNQENILRIGAIFDDFIIDTTRFGVSRDLEGSSHVEGSVTCLYNVRDDVWNSSSEKISLAIPKSILNSATPDSKALPEHGLEVSRDVAKDFSGINDAIKIFLQDKFNNGLIDELYFSKLSSNRILEEYEVSVASFLSKKYKPEDVNIYEIGSGLGCFSVAMASMGYTVFGYEGGEARWQLSNELVDFIKPTFFQNKPIFKKSFFPNGFKSETLPQDKLNILVSFNVTASFTKENQEKILKVAGLFDRYILDFGRFGENRNSDKEVNDFLNCVTSNYYDLVEFIYSKGSNQIYEVSPKRIMD